MWSTFLFYCNKLTLATLLNKYCCLFIFISCSIYTVNKHFHGLTWTNTAWSPWYKCSEWRPFSIFDPSNQIQLVSLQLFMVYITWTKPLLDDVCSLNGASYWSLFGITSRRNMVLPEQSLYSMTSVLRTAPVTDLLKGITLRRNIVWELFVVPFC